MRLWLCFFKTRRLCCGAGPLNMVVSCGLKILKNDWNDFLRIRRAMKPLFGQLQTRICRVMKPLSRKCSSDIHKTCIREWLEWFLSVLCPQLCKIGNKLQLLFGLPCYSYFYSHGYYEIQKLLVYRLYFSNILLYIDLILLYYSMCVYCSLISILKLDVFLID